MDKNDTLNVKKLLNELLNLFKSNSQIVDHIYLEQKHTNKYKQDVYRKDTINNVIKIKP